MNTENPKIMPNSPQNHEFIEKYNFIVTDNHIEKGTFYPFHWHDYFECEIVLSGCASHIHNDDSHTIAPGSAYLLTYSDVHALTALSDMQIFCIKFNQNFLPAEITEILDNKGCSCTFSSDELEYIKERIKVVGRQDINCTFYQHMMTSLLTEIVLMIIGKSGISASGSVPSLVQKATSYILRHFREHITLASIAGQLNVTPKHLGVIFKQNTNMYFNDYINNTRLRYACNLLSTTDLSVKEIAYSSGYTSVEYFLDVFKKKIKMTPTHYRNATKN